MVDVAGNLAAVRGRIELACARAGRDPSEVELLPVSKMHAASAIRDASAAGYRRFGENRPQALPSRAEELTDLDIELVAIGRVQTNKAKLIAQYAAELQSLDSLDLARALERRLDGLGRRLPVLVQVNTSGEDAKTGFAPEGTLAAVAEILVLEHLDVRGLMTMAANTDDSDAIRRAFRTLRALQTRLRDAHGDGFDTLSMGMSGDYELAVEEGSTCVRLGTTIFGTRPQRA